MSGLDNEEAVSSPEIGERAVAIQRGEIVRSSVAVREKDVTGLSCIIISFLHRTMVNIAPRVRYCMTMFLHAIVRKWSVAPLLLYGTSFRLSSRCERGKEAMTTNDEGAGQPARKIRADAQRNEQTLLAAAASVFVTSGVEAPVRDIAAAAGVGMGTIYRHFPTRADLVVAVYRHQVEACAEAGPILLAKGGSPHTALGQWVNLFVDFLVTKHGLATVLQPDSAGFGALHASFLDRLVPVCAQLLEACAQAGEIHADLDAYELMRGIGNLCVGADTDPRYDARRMVALLIAGLLLPRST